MSPGASNIPFTVFLHVLEADLGLPRPAQTKENEPSLIVATRRPSRTERGSERLEIEITSREDRAEKMGDFEVFVV